MIERSAPAIIRGPSVISLLNEQNHVHGLNILYTGRSFPPDKITPQPVYWKRDQTLYPDSDGPVVCATDEATVAVFMAIAPRGIAPFGYTGNENGGTSFYIHDSLEERFRNSSGYVAVLDNDENFEDFDRKVPEGWTGRATQRLPERRTANEVIPLFNVAVHFNDFSELLEQHPQSELLPY